MLTRSGLFDFEPWQSDAGCLGVAGTLALEGQMVEVPDKWRESLGPDEIPNPWYPPIGQAAALAKRWCNVCPVRENCLDYAIRTGEKFGVWGGKSERERRPLRVEFLAEHPELQPGEGELQENEVA